MHSNIQFAQITPDISLPYVEQGDPAGMPVVMLHGITDSLHSFDLVREHLPASIRAIAVTQRGHGDASKPDGYRPADLAGDLLAFFDLLGIERAVVVGHSMGSFVAQRFAIDNPERVASLVLIGSFTGCRDNQGVIEFVNSAIASLEDPITQEFARAFQESTVTKPVEQGFFDRAVAESRKVPARVWKQASRGLIENDHTEELKSLSVPVLLLWGEEDSYFDASEQAKLLRCIPNGRLKAFHGVGHAPGWEVPVEVADAIAAEWSKAEGAGRQAFA